MYTGFKIVDRIKYCLNKEAKFIGQMKRSLDWNG